METGALLNEAFLRLVHWKSARWQNRSHFYGLAPDHAAGAVDHARSRAFQNAVAMREGIADEASSFLLNAAPISWPRRSPDAFGCDRRAKSKVVELRFFGGLSVEETAEVLKISPFTVIRDWNFAKAWLHSELTSPISVVCESLLRERQVRHSAVAAKPVQIRSG